MCNVPDPASFCLAWHPSECTAVLDKGKHVQKLQHAVMRLAMLHKPSVSFIILMFQSPNVTSLHSLPTAQQHLPPYFSARSSAGEVLYADANPAAAAADAGALSLPRELLDHEAGDKVVTPIPTGTGFTFEVLQEGRPCFRSPWRRDGNETAIEDTDKPIMVRALLLILARARIMSLASCAACVACCVLLLSVLARSASSLAYGT